MRPSLVIFDCDGVLVDSERIAGESMRASLLTLGLDMTIKEIRNAFVGLSWADCIAKIEERTGEPIPDTWRERTQLRDRKWFADRLDVVPGIREVVEAVRTYPLDYCVASSGDIEKMNFTLGLTKLLPHFEDRMFNSAMVERGKPHPDLFLHAAAQRGHAPEGCAVIEDSIYGVKAGIAAGMKVFAYAGDPHADEQALADAGGHVFDDMSDLPKLLKID